MQPARAGEQLVAVVSKGAGAVTLYLIRHTLPVERRSTAGSPEPPPFESPVSTFQLVVSRLEASSLAACRSTRQS